MSTAIRTLLLGALLGLVTATGWSYTRPRWEVDSEVVQSRWPVGATIPVVVNVDPPNSITPGSQPFLAVRNMFERRATYAHIQFDVQQGSDPDNLGQDGVNLVTFKDTPENRSVVMNFGAVAWFWRYVHEGQMVVDESDIVFNPQYDQTTEAVPWSVDIESLGGHEVIHFLSLDHSAVLGTVAYPNIHTHLPDERNLALDDIASVNFLYPFPDNACRTGSLTGTVEKPGGVPVFGAHVVALHQPDNAPVSEISVAGGEWRIDGLPPGQYHVYVEPLDGPATQASTFYSFYYGTQPADTDFPTTFVGGYASPTIYEVTAGAETSVGLIEVASNAGPLSLVSIAGTPTGTPTAAISAINLEPSSYTWLTLSGPGLDQVPASGIHFTGTGWLFDEFGIIRGTLNGNPFMMFPLFALADASPGVQSIFVTDGTNVAALTGAIEIHPSTPRPSLLRNDEATSLDAIIPYFADVLPLDPTGPDGFPGIGEGTWRALAGSDDDDDLYAAEIESGFLDPDLDVLTDPTRPLVLYRLDDPSVTLTLGKTPCGRLAVYYERVGTAGPVRLRPRGDRIMATRPLFPTPARRARDDPWSGRSGPAVGAPRRRR